MDFHDLCSEINRLYPSHGNDIKTILTKFDAGDVIEARRALLVDVIEPEEKKLRAYARTTHYSTAIETLSSVRKEIIKSNLKTSLRELGDAFGKSLAPVRLPALVTKFVVKPVEWLAKKDPTGTIEFFVEPVKFVGKFGGIIIKAAKLGLDVALDRNGLRKAARNFGTSAIDKARNTARTVVEIARTIPEKGRRLITSVTNAVKSTGKAIWNGAKALGRLLFA